MRLMLARDRRQCSCAVCDACVLAHGDDGGGPWKWSRPERLQLEARLSSWEAQRCTSRDGWLRGGPVIRDSPPLHTQAASCMGDETLGRSFCCMHAAVVGREQRRSDSEGHLPLCAVARERDACEEEA
jgi:hypothetical protein